MSIVIIGGHERMEKEYLELSKCKGCKAKVFTKKKGSLEKCLGCPDAIILINDVVSHCMAGVARKQAKKLNIPLINCNSGSKADIMRALQSIN